MQKQKKKHFQRWQSEEGEKEKKNERNVIAI